MVDCFLGMVHYLQFQLNITSIELPFTDSELNSNFIVLIYKLQLVNKFDIWETPVCIFKTYIQMYMYIKKKTSATCSLSEIWHSSMFQTNYVQLLITFLSNFIDISRHFLISKEHRKTITKLMFTFILSLGLYAWVSDN